MIGTSAPLFPRLDTFSPLPHPCGRHSLADYTTKRKRPEQGSDARSDMLRAVEPFGSSSREGRLVVV